MFDITTVGLFGLASVLLAITPGPDMIYIATRSIAQGRNAGIVSALGVYAGILIHTLAAALGLSALIAASAVAFSVVKYTGAAYLIYLGMQTFLSKPEKLLVKSTMHAKLSQVFYQGLLVNLLNPKIILFFLAFLPQFVDPTQGSVKLQLLLLGILFVVLTLPINIGVGLVGGQLGIWLRTTQGIQQATKWVTGSIYITLGVTTAMTGPQKT
ncbi:MAG: LysE family translocator [Pleurocapsa sp.]